MKTLIAYTTKYGSVEKSANMLKNLLNDHVTIKNVRDEKVKTLELYDTVILGGSIYMGKIQPELTNFINSNMSLLLDKNIAIFVNAGETDPVKKDKQFENAFPEKIFKHAFSRHILGDEVDFKKISLLEKTMLYLIKKTKESYSNLDINEINKMANEINNSK